MDIEAEPEAQMRVKRGQQSESKLKMKAIIFLVFLGLIVSATSAPAMDIEAEPEAQMRVKRGTGSCMSKWRCAGFLCSDAHCVVIRNNCSPAGHARAFYSAGTCECTCY